ncbi:MAG: T9SS type A sorting domain-containing protein, partial [bacterium]
PFNAQAMISFDLPQAGVVGIDIFDVTGSRVGVGLAPTRRNSVGFGESDLPAGSHTFTFNAVHLPSGIYFVRVSAGGVQQVKKMVLIK